MKVLCFSIFVVNIGFDISFGFSYVQAKRCSLQVRELYEDCTNVSIFKEIIGEVDVIHGRDSALQMDLQGSPVSLEKSLDFKALEEHENKNSVVDKQADQLQQEA